MSFLGLTVNGVAIGMAFFIFAPGVAIVDEYTVLYLEQLGYSNTWIGLVPMLGLFAQIVGLPLLSYFADKYRARKLFLFLSVAIAVPSMLVLLLRFHNQSAKESKGRHWKILTRQSYCGIQLIAITMARLLLNSQHMLLH